MGNCVYDLVTLSPVYGNGKWIAMNEAGDTWESTDNAQTWTQGPDLGNVQYDVASLCFGNGRFVAAAYDLPNDIIQLLTINFTV